MFFEQRLFWLPKDVQHVDEYQDACRSDPKRGVAAIADGASSSLFSGSWARILADKVIVDPPDLKDPPSLPPWLAVLRQKWAAPINPETLPWHQKPKLAEGAHSTLLWIELFADFSGGANRGKFDLYGYAVGDSCLFHIRGNQVLRTFPIEDSRLFDTHAHVIGSVDRQKDHLITFHTLEDVCQAGDVLALCTDAVAAWAMANVEAGNTIDWEAYWSLTDEQWRDHISELRSQHVMRYDDATLLLLRVLPPKAGRPA